MLHEKPAKSTEGVVDHDAIERRSTELFESDWKAIVKRSDHLFAWLLIVQWLAAILAALLIAPDARSAAGVLTLDRNIWFVVFLGAICVAIPSGLGLILPGSKGTRYAIAIGQMLIGALLIHITGGRIETHFHIFVSLALLSFYRDWRVLATASAVALIDHAIRGRFWPESLYGIARPDGRLFVEHAGWLALTDAFLMRSCRQWLDEMRGVARRRAELESAREHIEANAEFAAALNQTEQLATYEAALRCISRVLRTACSVLHTVRPDGTLEPRYAMGLDEGPLDAAVFQGDGLPATVARTREPKTLLGPFGHANLRVRFGLGDVGLQSVRSWPIVFQHRCLGVLTTAHVGPVNDAQRGFLAAGLDQLAIRMNAFLIEEQRLELLANLQTQSRALQEESRKADRANRVKSEFLANMSHELRTPMNSIMGFTQRLIRRIGDSIPERDLDALKTVDRNAKHLLGLINNILDLSKIEAGKMDIKRSCFDPSQMIREVFDQAAPLTDGKPVELKLELPERDLPEIVGDPIMLKQIVINLVSNGIKYTERGSVTLAARTGRDSSLGRTLEISVRDTGIGISPEDRARLFQKFTQLDGATTRKVGGTGLGLVICLHYAKLHGGRIDLTSEPGVGSEFTLVMPIDPRRETEGDHENAIPKTGSHPIASINHPDSHNQINVDLDHQIDIYQTCESLASTDHPQRRGVTILCVDDEPDICKYLKLTFEDAGFRVVSAFDYDSAVEGARLERPDLICLDLRMPGKSGYDVIENLRSDRELASVPIIVVSVESEEAKALDAGARCYLAKPVDAEELVARVREILRDQAGSALVVEDDPDTARLLSEALADQGFDVRIAANGREALKRLAESTPSVIVLDLMMPVMDGFAFLKHIKLDPLWNAIPVVVLTAKSLETREIEELSRSEATVLTKGRGDTEHVVESILKTLGRAPCPSPESRAREMEVSCT